MIEEASAEEEELLGMSGEQEEGQLGGDGDSSIERDPVLIKVNYIRWKWDYRKEFNELYFICINEYIVFIFAGIRQISVVLADCSFRWLLQSLRVSKWGRDAK